MQRAKGIWVLEDMPSPANTIVNTCNQLNLPVTWSTSYREYRDSFKIKVPTYPIVFIDNTYEDKEDVGYAMAHAIKSQFPQSVTVSSTFDERPIHGTDEVYDKNGLCNNINGTMFFIKYLLQKYY